MDGSKHLGMKGENAKPPCHLFNSVSQLSEKSMSGHRNVSSFLLFMNKFLLKRVHGLDICRVITWIFALVGVKLL